jgi:hypothetical protein
MVEKKVKKVGARHGKSKGRCIKCDKEFLLKRVTKHSSTKVIKADCGCKK